MSEITYLAYDKTTLNIVGTDRAYTNAFRRLISETPGAGWLNVSDLRTRGLLARINAANGTDYGGYYTVRGKDGNMYNIGVEVLTDAVGELYSHLKVCHRIVIEDSGVLESVLIRHFSHEIGLISHKVEMPVISRIGERIAADMHLYFTFKAK
jgi:hypothetical protein